MMVAKNRKAKLQALPTEAVNKIVTSLERYEVLDGRPPLRFRKRSNHEGTLDPRSTKIWILWTPGLLQEQNQEG